MNIQLKELSQVVLLPIRDTYENTIAIVYIHNGNTVTIHDMGLGKIYTICKENLMEHLYRKFGPNLLISLDNFNLEVFCYNAKKGI